MNKEFVPYELALKLKEIGFDEECFSYYHNRHEPSWVKTLHRGDTTKNSVQNLYQSDCAAPTFSQAFRWFREESNQHSFIELVFEDEIRFDYVLYVNEDEDDCIDYGDGPFETYEDAELALLDKLIEIAEGIKSKK